MTPPPPRSTLFPYTTLFRSQALFHWWAARFRRRRLRMRERLRRDSILGAPLTRASCEAATRREGRSEEHTSELQSPVHLVCRLLLEKKKKQENQPATYDMTN